MYVNFFPLWIWHGDIILMNCTRIGSCFLVPDYFELSNKPKIDANRIFVKLCWQREGENKVYQLGDSTLFTKLNDFVPFLRGVQSKDCHAERTDRSMGTVILEHTRMQKLTTSYLS